MSDNKKVTTLRVAGGYEPPQVTREALDSGGNYVSPSWGGTKNPDVDVGTLGGISTHGLSNMD
ncbi:MAG: cyclohexanecarboxylate-CoA ligase [Lentisphaerae bacterium]|jgi:hypothetical protein|nr:cyclohexanecarboxylate-CoA ligase [Lentisphaerota bacterium]